ncbi:MAG: hypothetical protein CVV53_00665 [Spirochaetae bacterium HGW-Spirochaetae-9]|nr:MAG: hypothetical protein CVV53_00665 [Spirochaetae bacterium HGW-Spirochaetae-9]
MSEQDKDQELPIEIVHLYVYDIGRAVDLTKAASLIPAYPDIGFGKRRDTPSSLTLPKPLVLTLNTDECDGACFDKFTAVAKIYDDGALTLVVRFRTRSTFTSLAAKSNLPVSDANGADSVEQFADSSFQMVVNAIKDAVTGLKENWVFDKETYTAFCILECPGGSPEAFLHQNRDLAAALLAGEEPGVLHESQVRQILEKPMSYRKEDIAIFDFDRCIIIDPARDYEDVLLIAEHANYRLIELRVLDNLLDRWLDEAEKDIRKIYLTGGKARPGQRSVKLKLGRLQTLRFDALFTLENLDNSSKIIGDYFLGLIYERLCGIFNTDSWKLSVGKRLDALQNVYELLKSDTAEKRMLTLEVVFIVVCIVLPLIQIVQVMVSS